MEERRNVLAGRVQLHPRTVPLSHLLVSFVQVLDENCCLSQHRGQISMKIELYSPITANVLLFSFICIYFSDYLSIVEWDVKFFKDVFNPQTAAPGFT